MSQPVPLWRRGAKPPGRSAPTPSRGVTFYCMGRHFVFDPDDLRLHLADDPGDVLLQRRHDGETVGRPQFALADTPPRTVVVIPTLACNLRCRYCFARGPHETETAPAASGAISREAALDAVRLIPPNVDATVGFFGGEPLLALPLVRTLVNDFRRLRRDRPFRFTMTTNAVLLDDEAADFLEEHHFGLVISVDGPPELHDDNRPDAAGRPTYPAVADALARIGRRPELARRVTLRGTYDGRRPALLERVRHLNELARRFGFANVSVEPADLAESCSRPRGGDVPAETGTRGVAVTASAELEAEYHAVARWYADELKAGRKPLFHHLAVRLERLRERRAAPSECGAGVGYLTVAPDGVLYACHRLGDSAVGDTRRGIDPERQAAWRDNRYYQREGCPSCWLRNVCGGGCRLASRHRFGNCRQPDPLGCWLTDVCVRASAWILAETFENDKGE